MNPLPARDPTPALSAMVEYPSSDGEPLAENHEQYKWIVRFGENLDFLIPNAFVGADSFWYPVEGHPEIRTAPDTYVAFGRPKWARPSYKQWEEGNVAPAIAVEVWSPSNTFKHMLWKLHFYQKHGVQEFWSWDPDRKALAVFVREDNELKPVATDGGWVSPLTGVRLEEIDGVLHATGPDGVPFRSGDEMRELIAKRELELESAHKAAAEARETASQAEASQRQAEASQRESESRAEMLAAKLRALGIDPDAD